MPCTVLASARDGRREFKLKMNSVPKFGVNPGLVRPAWRGCRSARKRYQRTDSNGYFTVGSS